ncbi:hypothetical protein U1Q18_011977 [Sarracenia purpurea var. burkii]
MRRLRGREGEGDEGHGGIESEASEGGDNGDGRRVQDHTAEEAKEGKETTLGKIVELKDTAVDTAKKAMGFVDWQEKRNGGEGCRGRGARLEPDEAAVFVYCGATAPPRRFSEPETAAAFIADFQEKYGATETLLGTRDGGGIDRRLSIKVWWRDFIGDFQDAIDSNLAGRDSSQTRRPLFVYSGATAPPRPFSEPDTAAALIGDFQEQYGCVILSETVKTPLQPTLRGEIRARRGGRVRRLSCRYGATEMLLGTRHGVGIDRRLSIAVWLRDFIGDFQDAILQPCGARLEPNEAAVFVYSGPTAPPRRFSEPDTAAELIRDFPEQYGCVILSETFKTPLPPTLPPTFQR